MNSIKSLLKIANVGLVYGFLLSALLSQLISNVPTTVLLIGKAPFISLLWGSNIGGNGTVIASLANLIALRRYGMKYAITFMKISLAFFVITLLIGMLFLSIY